MERSSFSLSLVYNDKLLFTIVETNLPQVLQNILPYQDYRTLPEDL